MGSNNTEITDEYLVCPAECPIEVWVSPEDPDASLGQLWNHVLFDHAGYDADKAEDLMKQVKVIERPAGN